MKISELQRERMRKMIGSRKIGEICEGIGKLPLSDREKIVLKALVSRELVDGFIGNTAKDIMQEVEKSYADRRGSKIGIRIWTILGQLVASRLVQTVDGFPRLYVLNREFNPIYNIMFPYSLLLTMYDVLPNLNILGNEVVDRVSPTQLISPSQGAYSTNQEFVKILIELIDLAKVEILSSSMLAQSFEEYSIITYALINALERGVRIHYLLSNKVSAFRVEEFTKMGVNVRVANEETLRRHGIPNIDIVDRSHFMEVNRYEHSDEEKRIRFGFWAKHNKTVCAKYVQSFWDVWKSCGTK